MRKIARNFKQSLRQSYSFAVSAFSQCGGQGFDPPLLHQKIQLTYGGSSPAVFVFVGNTLPSRAGSVSRPGSLFVPE